MDEHASINTPEASSGTASCWQSLNLRAAFLPKGRRKHTHINSAADKVSHIFSVVNPDSQTATTPATKRQHKKEPALIRRLSSMNAIA